MHERMRRRAREGDPDGSGIAPAQHARGSRTNSGLTVGSVDDPAERDADRYASSITSGLGLGRMAAHSEGGRRVATADGGRLADTTSRVLRSVGGGSPIDTSVANRVQPLVDMDLASVRVHTGPKVDSVAGDIDARAFTIGSNVYFRSGEYQPGSRQGMHTLAHELGHVAQSSQRVHRLLSFTGAGEAREGNIEFGDDVGALVAWQAAADAIHKLELNKAFKSANPGVALNDPSNTAKSFAEVDAAKHATGALAVGGQALAFASAVKTGHSADKHLRKAKEMSEGGEMGSSILRNLGAQEAEESATGVLSNTLGASGTSVSNFALQNVPGLDAVVSFQQGAIQTKAAIEDATAAGKLQKQKRKVKHELDQAMPMAQREARFTQFLALVAEHTDMGKIKGAAFAATKFKRGELARFQAEMTTQNTDLDELQANQAKRTTFLQTIDTTGGKDFGKGTETRKAFDATANDAFTDDAEQERYETTRSLGKVAGFGHRRKAETATVNSVDAAGNFLDGAGTLTAAADAGATKVAGKVVKGASGTYKGTKGLVKRARRVHKLRKAKNDLAYGGKTGRGVWWGAKQFFKGNIGGSQDKVLGSVDTQFLLQAYPPVEALWTDAEAKLQLLTTAENDHALAESAVGAAELELQTKTAKLDSLKRPVGKHKKGHKAAKTAAAEARAFVHVAQAKLDEAEADEAAKLTAKTNAASAHTAARQAVVQAANAADIDLDAASKPIKPQHTKAVRAVTPADRGMARKLLQTQLQRRFDDLMSCLGSSDPRIQSRAIKIIKIIAETNLAGAIAKIDENDLIELGRLHATNQKDPKYALLRDALGGTFERQLAGIGG